MRIAFGELADTEVPTTSMHRISPSFVRMKRSASLASSALSAQPFAVAFESRR
jgi:hypothetical protein